MAGNAWRDIGELGRLQGQVMEWYVRAQGAASWRLHVRSGRLGLVWAGYVRSVFKRPVMILRLPVRWWGIIKRVGSARKDTYVREKYLLGFPVTFTRPSLIQYF